MIQPRKFHVKSPKSKDGTRWIDLLPEVVEVLMLEHDRQQRMGWKPTEIGNLVCRNRYGAPLSEKSVRDRVHRFLDAANIDRRSYYALRHTFASIVIESGEGDFSLADVLGHSDPAFTKRVYGHMFEAARQERAERLRAQFNTIAAIVPGAK